REQTGIRTTEEGVRHSRTSKARRREPVVVHEARGQGIEYGRYHLRTPPGERGTQPAPPRRRRPGLLHPLGPDAAGPAPRVVAASESCIEGVIVLRHARAGKGIDELDTDRLLVRRQPRTAVGDQVISRDNGRWVDSDDGDHRLAEP